MAPKRARDLPARRAAHAHDERRSKAGFVTASRFRRALGGVVDIIFAIVVGEVVATVLGTTSQEQAHIGRVFVSQTIQALLIARSGQSVGKHLAGTRIVLADGHAAGLLRGYVLRTLPYPLIGLVLPPQLTFFVGLIGIIDLLMILGADHRCGHDVVAQTFVALAGGSGKMPRKQGEQGRAAEGPGSTLAARSLCPRRRLVVVPSAAVR